MLAYLPEHELEKLVTEHGLPGSQWPEAGNQAAFKKALADIRKTGRVYHAYNDVVGLAFAVRSHRNEVIAALGLFLPRFRFKSVHKTAIMKGMSATAAAICACLPVNGNYKQKKQEEQKQ